MTIEIHNPELEALIIERMKGGGFEDIEDVILQALQSAPIPTPDTATGADLVAVMQASPCREIDIQPPRTPFPVRDVTF